MKKKEFELEPSSILCLGYPILMIEFSPLYGFCFGGVYSVVKEKENDFGFLLLYADAPLLTWSYYLMYKVERLRTKAERQN